MAAIFDAESLQEIIDQVGDVFEVVAEGRHGDLDTLQAKVQVLAKAACFHFAQEIAVRRGDDADVGLDLRLGAHGPEALAFNNAEQLGLTFERQLAHFIEKQGAFVGLLKIAGVIAIGAAEGAAAMSEQFRL